MSAGLYVHIPFCKSKCIYCDFYSVADDKAQQAVVDGLVMEYEHRRNEIRCSFDSIYFGGGTPSVLSPSLLASLVEKLPFNEASEITLEANPEDVSPRSAAFWRSLGFNRISLGIQSLDDSMLQFLNRRHSSSRALDAIRILHDAGFSNISADLIYGLPGLSLSRWRADLASLLSAGITHLSAYCLTYHETTPLHRLLISHKIEAASDDEIALQFGILREETARAGFEHYEISNFARPGLRSRHNSAYWDPASVWLGIGPSAHSFDGKIRRIDFPDIKRWLSMLPEPFEIDSESPLDLINDNIVTALRTLDGLDLFSIPLPFRKSLISDADRFIQNGNMTFDGRFLKINPSEWLISDSFIRELIR